MKKLLIATTAFAALATAASAQSGGVLNVLDWGGAYGQSHACLLYTSDAADE